MTEKIIKNSIEKNELQLNFWNKIGHFWVVIFVLIIPVVPAVFKINDILNKTEKPSKDGEIYLFIIPFLLSTIFYFLQKKKIAI